MKCSVIWLPDAFVWYFPRKPVKDSSLSRWWKCGSSGGEGSAAGASDGFPPQLLFKQHSLSHSSASLCKPFESRVCLYAHLLSEGAACWQILAWKSDTLMSQYLFLFFWRGRHIMFINNCLSKWVTVVIYSQLCVLQNGIWKSVFSMWLMRAGVSALLIQRLE